MQWSLLDSENTRDPPVGFKTGSSYIPEMSQSVVFLYYKKSTTYGLQQDAELLEKAMKTSNRTIRHADPLEPPVACDIAVHFEVPIYGWMPVAATNVLVVNPEWWEDGWDSYLHHTDILVFKCSADMERFTDKRLVPSTTAVHVLPWTTPVRPSAFVNLPKSTSAADGCLWLLGVSENKRAAAEAVLPLWKEHPTWPTLNVYTVKPLSDTVTKAVEDSANIRIHVQDTPQDSLRRLQAFTPCHIVMSAAEALSLVAHEGQAAGAFLIGNELPTYVEAFDDATTTSLIPSTLTPIPGRTTGLRDTFASLTVERLEEAVNNFMSCDMVNVRKMQLKASEARYRTFLQAVKDVFPVNVKPKPLPQLPRIQAKDLPCISVVTLLYNRRKFAEMAFHNLLITDYPKDKIEWVVVEDSDIQEEQASDKILKFGRQSSPLSVSYIPLQGKTSIGEKRNIAVRRAQHDIILMMDDDDHYPPSSFRRRVLWLSHPWNPSACVCTTIACYNLLTGTSAVNTPPFTLGLKERISEATLTFRKSWWEAKPFPTVNIAEGEGFLDGREHEVLELAPQQIIVAMSHGQNVSGRRIPPTGGKPSCFWGFPTEFLKFLHGLVGVEIDAGGV